MTRSFSVVACGARNRPAQCRVGIAAAVLGVAVLALSACGSGAGGGDDRGGSSGTLKVGLIIPQSGVYASIGTDIQNGFQTYLDLHDGELGGRKVQIKVGDEGSTPSEAIPSVQRLLSRDKVDVMTGIVSSAVAIALGDTINRAKKVTVISNAGADALTCEKKSDYVWRTSFANSSDGAALGKYMAKTLKPPTAYVIAPDYAAGHEKAAGFEAAFKAAGGRIVGTDFPPFGTTRDYQPYISHIKAAHPSGVWSFFAGAEAVQFVKQYHQLGLSGQVHLYGNNALVEAQALAAQGPAALGVRMSSYYDPALDNPENKTFATAYTKKHKEQPSVYALGSYDAAAVLDQALTTTKGAADGATLSKALGELRTIKSPRGDWHFDANHNPVETYTLYEVKTGADGEAAVPVQSLGPVSQSCK